MSPGDLAIIATFGDMTDEEARVHKPKVVLVDTKNRIVDTGPEVPGPRMPRRVDDLIH
jgi:aspartate 1-decarboxylase